MSICITITFKYIKPKCGQHGYNEYENYIRRKADVEYPSSRANESTVIILRLFFLNAVLITYLSSQFSVSVPVNNSTSLISFMQQLEKCALFQTKENFLHFHHFEQRLKFPLGHISLDVDDTCL
ncbi:hypothetical protein GQX74_011474 [Glossina fuscipes]|nr:hypothetical protein GQX74_011474 [Glossina fuscipes]